MIRRVVFVGLLAVLLATSLSGAVAAPLEQVYITQFHWMDSKWMISGPEGRTYWAMGWDFYQSGAGWVWNPAYFQLSYELYDDPAFLEERENGTIISPICRLASFTPISEEEFIFSDAGCKKGYRVFLPMNLGGKSL
jgi:hypothetical protein